MPTLEESIFQRLAEKLDPPPPPGPVEWCETKLGDFLWSKQKEIFASVEEHRKTAVHACHESSKSFTAGRVAAWWIDTHPPGTAMVVTTAPTGDQVKGILWKEINRAHKLGKLLGKVNQTEWWVGNEMVGVGRKPNEYDPSAFQGYHATYLLVIVDEAGGVEGLWDAVDSLVANENGRVLAIGNPDDPASSFAKLCKPNSEWNVIHIDGLKTPNFTGEQIPQELAAVLISQIYEAEVRAKYGPESPIYISKVRGMFPVDASDGVVPWSKAKACQSLEADLSDDSDVALGVDVGASENGDETNIRERRGGKVGRVRRIHSDDPETIVGEIVQAIHETGAKSVQIDVIGVGFGIAGWLDKKRRDGTHKAQVVKINVSERAKNPKRFKNRRSEIWWEIGRQLSEDQAWDLSEIDDDVMAQLTDPKYSIDSSGRIVVEPKDETRKRLGRSPDDADAILLSFIKAGPAKVSSAHKYSLPGVRSV